MTTRTVIPEDCMEQQQEGQFEAKMFFQSLLDHSEAMDRDTAGRAFFDLAFDEFIISQQGENNSCAIDRLGGFFRTIGELLWEMAGEQRGAMPQFDGLTVARPVPPNVEGRPDAD